MGRFRPVALRPLALAGLVLLPGCGFHPLYGAAGGPGAVSEEAEMATIRVDTIADRQGQKLRNYLIDDLQGEAVPPPPTREMVVTYSEAQADLGLNNNATTTRGQLTIGVSFQLQDILTHKVDLTGGAQQITGYNIQNSEFATILSRDDAEDRALKTVADNVALRIALYFRNQREGKSDAPTTPTPIIPGTPLANHAPGDAFDNGSPITQTP